MLSDQFASEQQKHLDPPEDREPETPTWEQLVDEHCYLADVAMDETLIISMDSIDVTDLLLELDARCRCVPRRHHADDAVIRLLNLSLKLIPLCNQIRKDRAAAVEKYVRSGQ